MDKSLIPTRSSKGAEEIASHKYGLEPVLRRTLILVDGHSDIAALQKKAVGDETLSACLERLMRDGFIQATISDNARDISPDANVQDDRVNRLKWQLVDLIGEIVGKDYRDRASKKIIASPDTINGLRQTLTGCVKVIKLTIDEGKAKELEQRAEEMIDRAEVLLANIS